MNKIKDTVSVLESMCINFQFTPQRLLKSAFSIRAFRGAEIRKISTKVELVLKSRGPGAGGGGVGGGGGGNKMQKSKSNENLPSSQSQMDIQMMSHTLAIKEVRVSYILLDVQ